METSLIGYENLQVVPYDLISLLELKINNSINQHGNLYLKGVISEENKDKYINDTETQVEIINISNNIPSTIFIGRVIDIKVQCIRNIYYLEVEAVTNTYELDLEVKRCSFQNKSKLYRDLITQVVSSYKGGDLIDILSNNSKIENFTIQYDETDWEFIKRMASRFSGGLVADISSKNPRFWFGIPNGKNMGELSHFNYSVNKYISKYRYLKENDKKNISEKEILVYEIETDKILNIGDIVTFKEEALTVCEYEWNFKKGIFRCKCNLKSKKGMIQKKLYNDKLIGLSIEGKVIDVIKDKVKVHLEVDESQSKSEACEFTYSTPYTATGHAGWYCMPEIGDSAYVYFPDNKEENAYASVSVRKDNTSESKLSDPNIKYFRTPSGKELKFSDKEILITASDGEVYIKLNEENGIEIYSSKGIKISSSQDINMSANSKVIISADTKLRMSCKASSINMDGETRITGNEVKLN